MVTEIFSRCTIVYKIIFYIHIAIYFYHRWITQDITMLNYSFHCLVMFGLLTLIEENKS